MSAERRRASVGAASAPYTKDISCVRAMGVRIYELMKALRVLVIEDDALIAMLLSELLAGMGPRCLRDGGHRGRGSASRDPLQAGLDDRRCRLRCLVPAFGGLDRR